jgi:phage shock protein PspC (stress-responsive transcriptional regulator)
MAVERPPLARPRRRRVLGGVCAGIARRYGVSPWLVRLGFVASCLLPGPQIVLYIGLWIFMPKDP